MIEDTKKMSTVKKAGIGTGIVAVSMVGLAMLGSESIENQEFDAAVVEAEVRTEEPVDSEVTEVVAVEREVSSDEESVEIPDEPRQTQAENQVSQTQSTQTSPPVVSEPVSQPQARPVVEQQSVPEQPTQEVVTYCKGVDINRASVEHLKNIIHIDEERASEILRLRPFSSVGSMTRIHGIGPARVKDIEEQGLACV